MKHHSSERTTLWFVNMIVLAHQRWDVQMDRAAFEEPLSLMSKDMHEQLTSKKVVSGRALWSKAWFWDSQHHSHLNLRHTWPSKVCSEPWMHQDTPGPKTTASRCWRWDDAHWERDKRTFSWLDKVWDTLQGVLCRRTKKQQEAYWQNSGTTFTEKSATWRLYWGEIGEFKVK